VSGLDAECVSAIKQGQAQAEEGGAGVKTVVVPPDPGLLESMRSIGYTVESAVADIIDNSLAAGASQIEILFSAAGPFQVTILDDGAGMLREEAIDAMRLAAAGPSRERLPGDLGRFGLGLKTASLSQCRSLTVVTKQAGVLTALRWSLDHVIAEHDWSLIELDLQDVQPLLGWPQFEVMAQGTLVHWGDLDQLSITEGSEQADLDRVAQRVREHVALVFHLYNSGNGPRRVTFRLNRSVIEPADPFMTQSRMTQATPWESIEIDGQTVKLMAYTLPYLNRLSHSDRRRMLRLGGLRETQGFYVYRGSRLVIWGTWFRLLPRSEMAKLTRVRVDIPNSLDHLWALDVKKSTAEPPPQIRKRLGELAKTMVMPSRKVQEFRGRKVQPSLNVDYMWELHVNGEEFRYEINTSHPTIRSFTEGLSETEQKSFQLVIEDLQSTLPIIDAHNRMSGDGVPAGTPEDGELLNRASAGWELAKGLGVDRETFIISIARAEPYCLMPDFEHQLRGTITR
jgi:Histidine kinase-, DNA gyrase B-, and HSP90-like ATPase